MWAYVTRFEVTESGATTPHDDIHSRMTKDDEREPSACVAMAPKAALTVCVTQMLADIIKAGRRVGGTQLSHIQADKALAMELHRPCCTSPRG